MPLRRVGRCRGWCISLLEAAECFVSGEGACWGVGVEFDWGVDFFGVLRLPKVMIRWTDANW